MASSKIDEIDPGCEPPAVGFRKVVDAIPAKLDVTPRRRPA